MRFGRYDQKIEFVTFGQEPDGAGGYIPVKQSILITFARIDQLKQSGNLEQVQMGLPTAYRVGVAVRSGFEPKVGMSVVWRGETYQMINAPTVESVRYQKEWVFDINEKGNG